MILKHRSENTFGFRQSTCAVVSTLRELNLAYYVKRITLHCRANVTLGFVVITKNAGNRGGSSAATCGFVGSMASARCSSAFAAGQLKSRTKIEVMQRSVRLRKSRTQLQRVQCQLPRAPIAFLRRHIAVVRLRCNRQR